MTKELQDLAWSVLPKDFKEEVKETYNEYTEKIAAKTEPEYRIVGYTAAQTELELLFGIHNLTSDAEGEVELLHVTRQKVMGLYANAKKPHDLYTSATCINEAESRTIDHTDGIMRVLKNLFGSKCLPDETVTDCNGLQEPKPAEPKFKAGDKVRISCAYDNGEIWDKVMHGRIATVKSVYRNAENKKILMYQFKEGIRDFAEHWLEPCTEPEYEHQHDDTAQKSADVNSNRNLSQNIANCDKEFDNILKDGFRGHNRLHIAAMAMQGLLANPNVTYCHSTVMEDIESLIEMSVQHTDALISECGKGGNNGED